MKLAQSAASAPAAMCGLDVAGGPRDRRQDHAVPEPVEQRVEHPVEGVARAVVRAVAADQQEHRRDAGARRGASRRHEARIERAGRHRQHRPDHEGAARVAVRARMRGDVDGHLGRREPST